MKIDEQGRAFTVGGVRAPHEDRFTERDAETRQRDAVADASADFERRLREARPYEAVQAPEILTKSELDEIALRIAADRAATVEMIDHPPHYTSHPSGVECISITEHMNFCLGNAVKYIWRAGKKGKAIEDLKKARWYIDREIARLKKT